MHKFQTVARLTALCLGTSALTLASAAAAVINYPDGSTNATPIVLIDNSAQLQVLTGSATQLGTISEAGGPYSVEKIGGGTLTLTAAATNTGGTVVSTGVLRLGNGGTLSSAGALTLNGGTFDLNGHSQTVSALSGAGTILGNQGFLSDNSSADTTLAASIIGADSLAKAGTGTLTLTGDNSFYVSTSGVAVNAGVLQVGDGGTSGTITGDIADNATLAFKRSDTAVYAGRISGGGSLQQIGSGTLILTGYSNDFTGSIVVASGALQIGDGISRGGSIDGAVANNGLLTFDLTNVDSISFSGIISGAGRMEQLGGTTTLTAAESYTGGTTVNGGTLVIGTGGSLPTAGALTVNGGTFNLNGHNQLIGALSGNGGYISLTTATLTANSATNTTFAGQFISSNNSGFLIKAGTGTLTLTGASILAGVTVSAGTLQIGNGGTVGTIISDIADNGALIFNRSDAVRFGGLISGTGSVAQAGSGTLVLVGANTYTGGTLINAGTLNIIGSIAASAVTVQSGAVLSGTGKVGATTVQTGGTLAPGSGGIGMLTVNGNLTMASGSVLSADISPSASDTVAVSGAASINGTLTATAGSGTYAAGQRYTLISATGGLSGTFSSFTTPGLPGYVKGRLGYDGNDAYLFLDPNALAPLLPSGASGNQKNVAAGVDAAVQGGAVLGGGFNALYGQTGTALTGSLDQLSGQIGSNTASAVGQSFAPFLTMLTLGAPQTDVPQTTARFAPDGAYGAAAAPKPAQSAPGEILIWGAAYGGHAGLSGNASSGAASLSANDYGFAVGAETRLGMVSAGAGIAVGQQRFSSGNGTGQSTDVTLGLYGRSAIAEDGYLRASFGYGWHDIATTRAVTVAGTDVLQAKMDAHQWGGRIEGGWRVSDLLTPFAAFEGTQFELPAYGERAASGASTFALSYAAHDTGESHSELGARLGRAFALEDGQLSAEGRLAWAHELEDAPFAIASFQGLTGSAFAVAGTRVADDTALLGLDFDLHQDKGASFGVSLQSQLGNGTTVWQGMGHAGWRW
jgi:outer membrane autotransporter protein